MRVEHVRAVVRQRFANGDASGFLRHPPQAVGGGADGRLRRAVAVDHGNVLRQTRQVGQRQRFTTAEDEAQCRQLLACPPQLRQEQRRRTKNRDAFAPEQIEEARWVEQVLALRDHQRATRAQDRKHLPDRHIEGKRRHLQHAIIGPNLVHAVEGGHGVGQRGVFDHHALGRAGRTRGVNHVGQMAQVAVALGVVRGPGHARSEHRARCVARQFGWGDQRSRHAVFEHKTPALIGHVGRQRHVRGTGLQHPQRGGHHRWRAFNTDAHHALRPHALRDQRVRDAVRPGVELGVTQPLAVADQRRRLRRARRLGLEQISGGGVARVVRVGTHPRRQLLNFRCRHDGQLDERDPIVVGQHIQQRVQPGQKCFDVRRLKKVGVEHKVQPHILLLPILAHKNHQRCAFVAMEHGVRHRFNAGKRQVKVGVLVGQANVEQARAFVCQPAQAADFAHREPLVAVVGTQRAADFTQQLDEIEFPVAIKAHRVDAHKQPGHLPETGIRSVEHRQANHQIFALPATGEIHTQRPQQHMEDGGLMAFGQRFESLVKRTCQRQHVMAAARDGPPNGRDSALREQRLGWLRVHALPIATVFLETLRDDVATVIVDEFGVRRAGEWRRCPAHELCVNVGQRAIEHGQRPAIPNQMVVALEHVIGVIAEFDQLADDQRRPRQIEWRFHPLLHPRKRRLPRIGTRGKIMHRQRDRCGFGKCLTWQPILVRGLQQHDAHGIVLAQQQREGALQQQRIHAPLEFEVTANVVKRYARMQLLAEPNFALGGREGMTVHGDRECNLHAESKCH